MPLIAVGIGVLLPLLMLLTLYMAQEQTLRPLLEQIRDRLPRAVRFAIPIVAMADAVAAVWARWIDPQLNTLTRWFDSVATVARNFYTAEAELATAIAADLGYFVNTRLPRIIRANQEAALGLIFAASVVARNVPDWIAELRADATARTRQLATAVVKPVADKLDFTVETLIPNLWTRLAQVHAEVKGLIVDDVFPRLGRIEVALPDLRARLNDARRLLDDARAWLVPIAAVFSATAVVSLLRHVRTCRPKTEKLCTVDESYLDELLDIALLLPALAVIVPTVRNTAIALGEAEDEVRRLLGSTLR